MFLLFIDEAREAGRVRNSGNKKREEETLKNH
jgi:hypothetical protein